MKLIVLLLGIYSLIFYQQYKIQKSRPFLPDTEFKTVKPYNVSRSNDRLQDFKTADYLIRDSVSIASEHPISKAGFYQ